MKFSSLYCLASALLFGPASGKIFVRNTFDQELPPADTIAIEQAGAVWLEEVEAAGATRRNLRLDERELQTYKCNYWCAGFPCGQCYVWKSQCWNWCPRRLQKDTEVPPMPSNVRKLNYHSAECQEKIDEALLIMEGAVSTQSESIVEQTHFTCFEEFSEPDEAVCEGIEVWNMWDSVTNAVTHANFQQGTIICLSTISTKNLEAVVSDACDVARVEFVLTGPEDYRYTHAEKNAMYFMFGNRAEDVGRSFNEWIPGDYTVDATVKLENGAGNLPATVTFTVDGNC